MAFKDTDKVLVNRDGADHQSDFVTLQYDVTNFGLLPSLPCDEIPNCAPDLDTGMPWDHIPRLCARFHLQNIVGPMKLQYSNHSNYFRVWDMDGRNITRFIDVTNEDSLKGRTEVVMMVGGNYNYPWMESNATWDFGELTNTCQLMSFEYMFQYCTNFNSDVSMFDFRNCIKMKQMFYHAENFDQDMSNICIPRLVIDTEDAFAFSGIENQPEKHPKFGKECNGGNS